MLLDLHAWARPAVEAVLNGAWQGVLLFGVLAAGMRLAGRTNAATRYAVWWVGLAGVLALPAAGWAWARGATGAWPLSAMAFAGRGGEAPLLLLPEGPWPELLLLAWGLVAAFLLWRVGRGYLAMQALKAGSEPLSRSEWEIFRALLERYPAGRPIRIRRSGELTSPITAGLANPMILMPADLLGRLRAEDLRHIVLHELTHVRRGDDRAILAQRVIEALFFFHPAVHWICARLDLEREIACDDRVVALTGARKAYARCLTRLAELGPARAAPLATGALLHRGHLVQRVTLLLDSHRRVGERVSGLLTTAALGGAAAAVVWLAGLSPVLGVPDGEGPEPLAQVPEDAAAADDVGAPPAPAVDTRAAAPAPSAARLRPQPAAAAGDQAASAELFAGYPDAKARALAEDAGIQRPLPPSRAAGAPSREERRSAEALALEEEDEEEEEAAEIAAEVEGIRSAPSSVGRPAESAPLELLSEPAVQGRGGPIPLSPRSPDSLEAEPPVTPRPLGEVSPQPPAPGGGGPPARPESQPRS